MADLDVPEQVRRCFDIIKEIFDNQHQDDIAEGDIIDEVVPSGTTLQEIVDRFFDDIDTLGLQTDHGGEILEEVIRDWMNGNGFLMYIEEEDLDEEEEGEDPPDILKCVSIEFEHIRSLLKPLKEWVEVYGPLEVYDSIEELQEISNEFIWAVVSVDSEELWIIPRSDVSEISEIVRWLVSDKPNPYDGLGILCEIRFFIDAMSRKEGVEKEPERVEAYIDFFKILEDDSDENIRQNIGYYDY